MFLIARLHIFGYRECRLNAGQSSCRSLGSPQVLSDHFESTFRSPTVRRCKYYRHFKSTSRAYSLWAFFLLSLSMYVLHQCFPHLNIFQHDDLVYFPGKRCYRCVGQIQTAEISRSVECHPCRRLTDASRSLSFPTYNCVFALFILARVCLLACESNG